MSEIFADSLIWIILYPLWLFILIGAARFFAVKMPCKIVSLLTLLGSFTGLIFSVGALPFVFTGAPVSETVFSFVSIKNFLLQFGVSLDKLAVVSLVLLYFVSFWVQLFSVNYMAKDPKVYRFYAYLNFFNFAMAILLVAPNLFQLYVGWELIGVVSYLFIAFKYDSIFKSKAALKTFLINRIGDVCFLVGLISLVYVMIFYAPTRFLSLDFSDFNLISTLAYAHTNELTFSLLCSAFIVAAVVKSAQFPFNSWLLSAMEAPTPVSALIHSATLVVAGVFLLLRLAPLYSLSPNLMSIIAVMGLLTAFYCSLCAIAQVKVKSLLAYSTSAHVGLMFAAIGFGRPDIALLYLIIHGLVKASLFLSYGASNNEYDNSDKIKLSFSFLVGSFALSGLLFAGLSIKELMYILYQDSLLFKIEYLSILFLGAFYIFRICALYFSSERQYKSIVVTLSIWALLIPVIIGSFWIAEYSLDVPFIVSLVGAILAFITVRYFRFYPRCLALVFEEGFFVDLLLTRLITSTYCAISRFLMLIDNWLAESTFIKYCARIGVNIAAFIEKYIFEYPIRFFVQCIKFASKEFELVQVKNAQAYIAYGALIIGVVFTTILLTYSLIIHLRGGMG